MNAAKRQRDGLIPMRVDDGFKSFVLDQLAGLDDVTPRSMFGGVGLYCAGVFFGLLAGGVLYLKVDGTNRPDYERAGAKPFKPYPNRSGTMQYYAVPLDVLESAPELVAWARQSVAVAGRTGSEPSRRRLHSGRSPRGRAK